MVSLSSGLLQFVSSANLVTPDSTGTSATSNNGLAQLSAMYDQLQSTAKSQSSTSSSSSTRLADDTYTSSTQSLTVLSSSASSKTSSSSTVSSASSSQASQSDTVTLANLVKNQTISGSSDVRQVLLAAMQSNSSGDPEATAWNELTDKVNSGNYSGALTALADYSTALDNSHIGTWADLSTIKSSMTALGSALQAGNTTDVQTAFTALTNVAPTHNLGLIVPAITSSTTLPDGQMAWVKANMTDALQKLGYTATNAAAEANAWMSGYAVDSTNIQVITAPSYDIALSKRPDVDQSIADQYSSVIADISQANSVTAMESTLSQLDSKYGTVAQGTGSDNASQVSVSVYA